MGLGGDDCNNSQRQGGCLLELSAANGLPRSACFEGARGRGGGSVAGAEAEGGMEQREFN